MDLIKQFKGLRRENYVIFFGKIVTSLGNMVWPVLTFIMNQRLGMNATTVAVLMVASGVVMLPLNLIGGKLADRFNKKRLIIVCDLISVFFYILCAFVPLSFTTLLLLLIAASCQGMEEPAYTALVADISKPQDRERAYSLLYLGSNIGMIAAPTIAGLLFEKHLPLSFIISGLAIGSSTMLIALLVKNIKSEIEESLEDVPDDYAYQKAREGVGLVRVLKDNKLIVLYIAMMAIYWSAYSDYGYLMPLDLARVHGEKGAAIYGTVSSINCVVVVLLTPFITKFFAKVTHTRKMLYGMVFLGIGYAVFLLKLGSIPFYYIAITLFTIGEIFATISTGPYISNRIPSSHRGRINGFMTMVQSGFYAIFTLVSGRVYDSMGYVAAWIIVIALLGVSIVAAIVLIVLDKKRYPLCYAKQS